MAPTCNGIEFGDIAMDMILDAHTKALTRRPRRDHRYR
jgi:hypothetical protein